MTKKIKLKNPAISIRIAKLNDLTVMLKMFLDTISTICKDDYSPEQIEAWISSTENIQSWKNKLTSEYFIVAESDNNIVGFASLENEDYIDFLYVHKDYQRLGIADKLYFEIEKAAIIRGATTLSSNVSKTARLFFEKKKFKVQNEQINIRQGVEIINYKMTKKF
ncbi:MAG: GNAT family N-acetyltransferase [Gammaproteobacteria bacterium]